MATAVTISIVVDSAQAQAAIGALNTSLAQTGTTASVGFQKASGAVQQLGGHATTGLDAVRLLSQEFGLRLPRAMEAMLSRMPAVTNALNALVGGLAGIAALEVFAHVGEGAYKLYNQYISLNAEADKFYETLKKTAQEDISNTRSIETTRRRISDATQNATAAPKVAQGLQGAGIGTFLSNPGAGLALIISGRDAAKEGTIAQGDMIKLGKVNLDQAHQQALAQIDLNHAMDASLVGVQKINAEAAKKKQIDAETRNFNRKEEMFYGNVAPGDTGAIEQRMKDQQADQEANAQKTVLGREASLAIMKAQDEAVQAGLEGDALYVRKREDGIRELTAQLRSQGKAEQQVLAETAAFAAKLDDEHAQRLGKQWHDAQQAQRTASQSGLTGAARVTTDFGNRLDQINSDRSLDPAVAAQLRIAAKTEEDQKLKEMSDNFTRSALLDAETRTGAELGGFARIEAEAAKAIAEKKKAYDELGGTGGSAAQGAFNADKSAITADANRKRSELAAQNNAEDLQYAQEASRAEARVKEQGIFGWVAAYKSGVAEINAEDERRTARMQEQAAKQGATQEQIAARKVEIDRTANAQIQEQNLQMQHQIAGDLQSAFTNPGDFIKTAMEKMFFEIVASWVMKMHSFQAIFGRTMGGLQPGSGGTAGGGGIASGGGILDKVLHGSGGAFNSGTAQGGYSAGSSTSAGFAGYSSGSSTNSGGGGPAQLTSSSSGGGIGSTLSGVGSLAQTALGIPGLGNALGGGSGSSGLTPPASSGLMYNDATGQFDSVADPSANSTLSTVPGFGGSMNDDGTIAGNASSVGASTGMGAVTAGMGGYQVYQSTMNTYEGGSVLQGMLGDAAGGAAIGGLFGPEGAAIGAAAGAALGGLAGIFGLGAKGRARNYYKQNIRPELDAAATNTQYGDFQTAIANVNRTSGEGLLTMKTKFGNSAGDWVNDHYMKKYVEQIDSMIATSAAGGRQFTQLSAMQFHSGGTISGFGSFRTSDDEGYIHAKMGETVMTPGASSSHGPMLSAMNAGASAADIATAYLANSGAAVPAQGGGGGGDTHFHVHTLDTKTMTTWLRGGGAKMITNAQNNYSAQYAGDGIG